MVKDIRFDGKQIYDFLFPDGDIFSAHWTSYAIIALLVALLFEMASFALILILQVKCCMTSCLCSRKP